MFSFSSSSGLYLLLVVLFLAVIVPLGGGPANEGGGVHAGVVSLFSSTFGRSSAHSAGGGGGGGGQLPGHGAVMMHPRQQWQNMNNNNNNNNNNNDNRNQQRRNIHSCCPNPPDRVRTREDGPLEVTVGVYILDISEVDPMGQAFMMIGYYWLHYNSCEPLPAGFEPYSTVFIENQNQAWAFSQNPDIGNTCYDSSGTMYICPTCNLPNINDSYVDFQFSASLKLRFNYEHYPMDIQHLYIAFEDLESDNTLIKLIPDPDSNIHPGVGVVGFNSDEFYMTAVDVSEQTSYGIFNTTAPKPFYSRVEIGVKLSRSSIFFTMKILPPTLVTLLVAGIILFIDPYNVDTRLGSAIFSLLTMVFLEVGFYYYETDTSKLTVIDWLYNWCYLLIVIIVFECVAIQYYLLIVNKIRLVAEVGAYMEDYELNQNSARHWIRKLVQSARRKQGNEEDYDHLITLNDDETEEEHEKRLRDEAKKIMHEKYRIAKMVDYIMAIVVFFLSTVGTTVVIVAATYA